MLPSLVEFKRISTKDDVSQSVHSRRELMARLCSSTLVILDIVDDFVTMVPVNVISEPTKL